MPYSSFDRELKKKAAGRPPSSTSEERRGYIKTVILDPCPYTGSLLAGPLGDSNHQARILGMQAGRTVRMRPDRPAVGVASR